MMPTYITPTVTPVTAGPRTYNGGNVFAEDCPECPECPPVPVLAPPLTLTATQPAGATITVTRPPRPTADV